MLNKIVSFSLNNRLFVLLAAAALIITGLYTTKNMDVDVFPDLTAPTVVVMTDAHGMAAEEVERLVTFPIETAVNGATDVRRVRSASLQGFSFVWVEFDWGTDIFKARQIVSEKMVAISGRMPEGSVPALAPQSSIMGEILLIGMQADSTSMMDLRTLADWVIKPNILATGGVSQVTNIGGDYKQYQVFANPQMMLYYGVSLEELEAVCRTMSKNSAGGILNQYSNEFVVRGMARTADIESLSKSVIKLRNNQPVTLADVADIRIGAAVKMGEASRNAKPAVILSVSKQPNANTLDVTQKIEKNLTELQKSLPPDVKLDVKIFRQSDFIQSSVNNVERALIEGAVLVIVILFLFLGSFRTTVISVIAIPLSLLGTIIVMKIFGININTMTLGGMCIAIGSLVDDAIIDVENVYKRLRQNHRKLREERQSTWDVVFNGSIEIRASILNATFIIIAAFVPLFFLSGMEGRMLKPLGIAYIVSLFMSLIVAMTVTPLLCKLMLSNEKYLSKNEKESWISRNLSDVYRKSLEWTLRNKKPVFYSTVGLFIVAVGLFFTMGRSFLPEFNEGALVISAVSKPGISLEESSRLGNLIEAELQKIPEVVSTARRTGRGELDEHSQSTNSAEIDVKFTLDKRSKEVFMEEVREKLGGVPGIATTVGQPLGHRIDHMLSGTRANIAIKIFGTDLSKLFALGNQVKSSIEGIDGLVDVAVEQQTETPQLQIRANRDKLMQYGITIERFNKFVELAFSGEKIGDIYEGQRSFDLVLRLNQDYTQSIDGLKTALIETAKGGKVPLEEVAEIISAGGPNTITRENVQRKMVVSANVAGRDLQGVVNDIQAAVNQKIALPEGYRVEYGGQFESAQNASRTLMIATILAIAVIFLLLFMEFRSVKLSGIVLLNLPLALIGGVFAVFFTSDIVSIPSIIGFITLFGIATRNGILLISNYKHLYSSNQNLSLNEIITKGSSDRLNPILMTALTAGLALIPMVINGDKAGNEIQSPMAIVILGGLLTSTFLNMYIIPIVYSWLSNKKLSQ
jgi:CzcA family heavy metal efflux pump